MLLQLKVWHARLLNKLKAYGVVGPILRILESFLQECLLKVVLDGQSSGISFGVNLIPGLY